MGPGPREGAGACSFAARAGGGGCWERPRRIRRGAMIPAARRRRLSGKRLGRRSAASGDSAPAGGLVQRGCAPHCRRRKVRSAPFPPAAKTAPAPLLRLSPSDPLRWAPEVGGLRQEPRQRSWHSPAEKNFSAGGAGGKRIGICFRRLRPAEVRLAKSRAAPGCSLALRLRALICDAFVTNPGRWPI